MMTRTLPHTKHLSEALQPEATQPRFVQRSEGRGFSLVELLVVIAVLAILIALTMTLAGGVTRSAKSRTAQDTIRVLDQSVEAWTAASGDAVPKSFESETSSGAVVLPSVDGRLSTVDYDTDDLAKRDLVWPSLSLYIASISSESSANDVIRALDSSIRSSYNDSTLAGERIELVRVEDPWGNPMRFVHPAYDGGWGNYLDGGSLTMRVEKGQIYEGLSFRRSWRPFKLLANGEVPQSGGQPYFGDADEGICPGGGTRAYFYSAGPDGDPGTIEDNVYSERPQFPAETVDIRN